MKIKLIIISFLLFAIMIFGLTTSAIDNNDDDNKSYKIGEIKKGDKYIYVYDTFDKEKRD